MINSQADVDASYKRLAINRLQIQDHYIDIESLQHVNEHILHEIDEYKRKVANAIQYDTQE